MCILYYIYICIYIYIYITTKTNARRINQNLFIKQVLLSKDFGSSFIHIYMEGKPKSIHSESSYLKLINYVSFSFIYIYIYTYIYIYIYIYIIYI